MKTKIIILSSAIVLLTCGFLVFANLFTAIDIGFSTKVSVKYYYGDKKIDAIVSSEDAKILKNIVAKNSFPLISSSPSCGFGDDISITFSNDKDSITICPACDGCGNLRVGNSDKYIEITDTERKTMDEILSKYGMVFPCV